MIATTAKLAELLEAYNPGSSVRTEESIEACDRLNKAGYTLARLVLTLKEALEGMIKDEGYPERGDAGLPPHVVRGDEALAAVEELRL